MRAYLDHAATTPLLGRARDAMVAAMPTGNASSLHAEGRAARRRVEESRELIAASLRVTPGEVVLTSGGTEADNLAVKGLWWARTAADPRRRRVLASRVEHHAVLEAVDWLGHQEGADVVWLDVDGAGRVDPAQLAAELGAGSGAGDVALVAVMWANNEVGTVQPIPEIAGICAETGVPLHVDAVQALGSIEVDASLPSTTAVSAHKLGGPPGVGALIVRRGVEVVALSHGGGQERGMRSGTLNVPAAAGFAAAVDHVVAELPSRSARLAGLRDALVAGVLALAPDAVLNGAVGWPGERLPGNAHVSFPGCPGDALLMLLDAAGVAVSTGSACSAGVPEPSHVLLAMGVDPELARSSLRFSVGSTSSADDVEALLSALPGALERARRAGLVRASTRAGSGVGTRVAAGARVGA
ncbi:MAG: cysteine desulfurase family protein [Candidatus Nanopelagicales bacterium]